MNNRKRERDGDRERQKRKHKREKERNGEKERDGVEGFFKGALKGIAGLVVKPVVGRP